MEFNSQICTTREQSERLIALGLKEETADMAIEQDIESTYEAYYVSAYPPSKRGIPAWSLHRLIEMMPSYIDVDDGAYLAMNNHSVTYLYYYEDYEEMNIYIEFNIGKNIYDDLINCIKWLIKEGHFSKEYLVNQTKIDEHCKGVLEYLDDIREEE